LKLFTSTEIPLVIISPFMTLKRLISQIIKNKRVTETK
jgi:hypothetical protein